MVNNGLEQKYHIVFEDNSTLRIAFYANLINYVEDLLEDAECEDIYLSSIDPNNWYAVVEGVNCKYPLSESIEVFSKYYNVELEEGSGSIPYSTLYRTVLSTYRETLHYKMKDLAVKTVKTRKEYYLGILFNGKAFIIEGEEDYVVVPGGFKQCFAAHTHPSSIAIPSRNDMKSIINLFLDRGLGHVIETINQSMAIYRVKPLTLEDYEVLQNLNNISRIEDMFKIINSIEGIVIEYL